MNIGEKAKQVLATVAPLLGTAIGGPFGALAGTLLATALGTKPGDDKAAETALLSASPQTLIDLKKSEQEFSEHMRALDISEEKLTFDDIANARAREATVKDFTPQILAYGITLGFFTTLGYLIAYGKPTVGGDVVLTMVGALGAAWTGIIAYYFGSSAGGADKTKALIDIAKD